MADEGLLVASSTSDHNWSISSQTVADEVHVDNISKTLCINSSAYSEKNEFKDELGTDFSISEIPLDEIEFDTADDKTSKIDTRENNQAVYVTTIDAGFSKMNSYSIDYNSDYSLGDIASFSNEDEVFSIEHHNNQIARNDFPSNSNPSSNFSAPSLPHCKGDFKARTSILVNQSQSDISIASKLDDIVLKEPSSTNRNFDKSLDSESFDLSSQDLQSITVPRLSPFKCQDHQKTLNNEPSPLLITKSEISPKKSLKISPIIEKYDSAFHLNRSQLHPSDVASPQLESKQTFMKLGNCDETNSYHLNQVDFFPNTICSPPCFKTARGAIIKTPSKDAFKRAAKCLFDDVLVIENNLNNQNLNLIESYNPVTNQSGRLSSSEQNYQTSLLTGEEDPPSNFIPSFSLASGKKLKTPTIQAIQKATEILKTVENNESCYSYAEDSSRKYFETLRPVDGESSKIQPDTSGDPPSPNFTPSFSLASGRKLKTPTSEAIKKANSILDFKSDDGFSISTKSIDLGQNINLNEKVRSKVPCHASIAPGPSAKLIKSTDSTVNKGYRPFKAPAPVDPTKTYSSAEFQSGKSSRIPLKISKPPVNAPRPCVFDILKYQDRIQICDLDSFLSSNMPHLPSHLSGDRNSMVKILKFQKSALDAPHTVVYLSSIMMEAKNKLSLATDRWIQNHYSQIVWKLQSYVRINIFIRDKMIQLPRLDEETIMQQLCYRYEREFNHCHRSVLKRACERDGPAGCLMVLFVSRLDLKSNGSLLSMEVSDGWYTLGTKFDPFIDELVRRRRLCVGQKIAVVNAILSSNNDEPVAILEAPEKEVCLQIFGNSVRPVPWYERLGRCNPRTGLLVHLSQIRPEGGTVACVPVSVTYLYPPQYSIDVGGKWYFFTGQLAFDVGYTKLIEEGVEVQKVRMCIKFKCESYVDGKKIDLIESDDNLEHSRTFGCSGVIIWREASHELYESICIGKAYYLIGMRPVSLGVKSALNEKHLQSTRSSRIISIPNSQPVVVKNKQKLVINGCISIETLSPDRECDLEGIILHTSTKHYWVLLSEDYQKLLKDSKIQLDYTSILIAIEKNQRSMMNQDLSVVPQTKIGDGFSFTEQTILFSDILYRYKDLRYNFHVFSEADYSMIERRGQRRIVGRESLPVLVSLIETIKTLTK